MKYLKYFEMVSGKYQIGDLILVHRKEYDESPRMLKIVDNNDKYYYECRTIEDLSGFEIYVTEDQIIRKIDPEDYEMLKAVNKYNI